METKSANDFSERAMTLTEIFMVVFVIGIFVAMLLPSGPRRGRHSLKIKAQLEMQSIIVAIQGYQSAYGRFPISDAEQIAAGSNDFTTGLTFGTGLHSFDNNSNVIAILMDLETYGNGVKTVNFGHVKNPQQTRFISATMSGDNSSPGVGTDGVYRDPWGNPYIITMDLNNDGQCKDLLYSLSSVSQNPPLSTNQLGFNGLINTKANGAGNNFLYHGKVMVWSAGPDKIYDTGPANVGANKDNALSWR